MNIVQMKERVDNYNDRTKSARFLLTQYTNTFNGVINDIFADRVENDKQPRKYQFEATEELKRELYTLIKTVTTVPVGDLVAYPADYRYFANMFTTVDGVRTYCRPIEMSMEGPILEDSFRKPAPNKTYYIEKATDFKVLWNGTAFTSAEITYLKTPQQVYLGQETDLINSGGTLAVTTQYIVFDNAVYFDGTITHNYAPGDIFTTTAVTTLISGSVMLASIPINTDMPDNMQDEISKLTSEIMMGNVQSFDKAQFIEKEAEEQ